MGECSTYSWRLRTIKSVVNRVNLAMYCIQNRPEARAARGPVPLPSPPRVFTPGKAEIEAFKVVKITGTLVSVWNWGYVWDYGLLGWAMEMYTATKAKAWHWLGWGPQFRVVLVGPNGPQMEQLARTVEAGKLKPIVSKKMPLEEAE